MGWGTTDESAGALVAEPSAVPAGESATVQLTSGRRISPEYFFVTGPAPTCQVSMLRDGQLVAAPAGPAALGIGVFYRHIAFETPRDAEPGGYRVCTVTETAESLADVCGTVTVTAG
jgi:hypothetical protein